MNENKSQAQIILERKIASLESKLRITTPYPNLPGVEIHITEHCNLNCQSCVHFSPLAEPEFLSLEEFEKDIKRLAKLTFAGGGEGLRGIAILGGEPLLHPDCVKFSEIARKYFPDSHICLKTNATLLEQQDDVFYQKLAASNIVIDCTNYPIKLDLDKIKAIAEKYGVELTFEYGFDKEIKTTYTMPLDLEGKQNPVDSFLNCSLANKCLQLVKGKLHTCCFPAFIRHFNKHFNQNLIVSELDYIDIHKAKNISEVTSFLAKPIPFCRYCRVHSRRGNLPWKVSQKKIEEWTM